MEKKRTSKQQFQIYIKYLSNNKILVTGKLGPTSSPEELDSIWRNLTDELNSCGDGPIRDVASWKKVFTEWKSAARKKARDKKPLSDLEAAVIQLTGSGAVSGLDVKELGSGPSQLFELKKDKPEEVENRDENITKVELEQSKPKKETEPQATPKKKRKGTGDVLCDAYKSAVADSGDKLQAIADSILEVARAIHRYCDIVEASNFTEVIDVITEEAQEDSSADDK